jgi:hypothetical protein
MQEQNVELTWYGPYLWFGIDNTSVFQSVEASRPGIYLWTIPHANSHLIYYVGETGKSFNERLTAHAQQYLSGIYRVYEPNKFALGEKELIWQGTWQKGTEHLGPQFISRYAELGPLVHQFLLKMQTFIGPVETDSRTRKRIEAAIARVTAQYAATSGGFQDADIRYARPSSNEKPITVHMHCPVSILGLPSTITA